MAEEADDLLARLVKAMESVSERLSGGGGLDHLSSAIDPVGKAFAGGTLDKLVEVMKKLGDELEQGTGTGGQSILQAGSSSKGKGKGSQRNKVQEEINADYKSRRQQLDDNFSRSGNLDKAFTLLNRKTWQTGGYMEPGATRGGAAGSAIAGFAKEAFDSLGKAWESPKAFTGMGQAAKGTAIAGGIGIGAAVGGPAGAAAGGAVGYVLGAAASKLFEAADKLKETGNEQLNAMFKYADVSPSMAMVQARFEQQRMMLGMERGERLADAAGSLAESQIEYEKAMAPTEDYWMMAKARVTAVTEDVAAVPLQAMADTLTEIRDLLGWNNPAAKQMQEAADARAAARGRPPRFGGGQGGGGDF